MALAKKAHEAITVLEKKEEEERRARAASMHRKDEEMATQLMHRRYDKYSLHSQYSVCGA